MLSALLYLVADHPGAPLAWVREILESVPLAACHFFYPEAMAALRAGADQKRLTRKDLHQALRGVEGRWPSPQLVESSPTFMRAAGLLAQGYSPKGADAVHLAAALAFAQGLFPSASSPWTGHGTGWPRDFSRSTPSRSLKNP